MSKNFLGTYLVVMFVFQKSFVDKAPKDIFKKNKTLQGILLIVAILILLPLGTLGFAIIAAILGAYEKLSMAETWAALTCRAAKALKRNDIGVLKKGNKADFIVFETEDFREVLYMLPNPLKGE